MSTMKRQDWRTLWCQDLYKLCSSSFVRIDSSRRLSYLVIGLEPEWNQNSCERRMDSWTCGRGVLPLMPALWDLHGGLVNFLHELLPQCGHSPDARCPECVESAVAVMKQTFWWPVCLAGQRCEVMWWGAGTARSSPSLQGTFSWTWSKR